MLIVGLTGGIGSGKSTVATLFKKLGITVIDADEIAREVVTPNSPLLTKIVEHFGKEIVDKNGHLQRRILRERIFQDTTARQWLEQLLHPAIYARLEELTQEVKSAYCIVIIPLLLETAKNDFVQRILVIDLSGELQISRTQARDHCSANQVRAIMQTQVNREQRLTAADDVIYNDGDLEKLTQQVAALHKHYIELASH